MIPFSWITEAYERISPYIIKTPIEFDQENNIYLKWENKQKTGSFKVRGALNKVLSLQPWEQQRGLVTASAGNHGQGVAIAGNLIDAPVTVFVSEHAVPAKLEAMKALGANIRQVSGGYDQAEAAGKQYAQNTGSTWISPYNDGQIIAGQGTICLEILKEMPQLASAAWVAPVGGGGLISGIGACLKEKTAPWMQKDDKIKARLIGVQSEASAFMHSIYYHGNQEGIADLPTLADGLSGAIEENSVTIPMVRALVDQFVLVSENEIGRAIQFAWKHYGEKIEGSAATALATAIADHVSQRPVVIIISGGNIQPETFKELVENPS